MKPRYAFWKFNIEVFLAAKLDLSFKTSSFHTFVSIVCSFP
jgi:hypothetical protein